MSKRLVAVGTIMPLIVCSARLAHAYRPFDGTDAAVARAGEFELELGPAQWLKRADRTYVVAPDTVLNLGLVPDTELVVDVDDFIVNGPLLPTEHRLQLRDTDVLLKHVFRDGVLQGRSGPSIAAEAGPLIPELNGVDHFGASLDVIVSQSCALGTVHVNQWARYTRDHDFSLFNGIILEGPHQWVVRPVGELFVDGVFHQVTTWSGLVGVIVTVRESFALDAAFRAARVGVDDVAEVRLGFTWTLPVWSSTTSSSER